MNNIKEMFKNIGMLTIGSLSTKLLSFFLIPLYTNVLTTEEYGTFDLINNTITILVPIITLNICDALFRYLMDKKAKSKELVGYSLRVFAYGVIIILLAIGTNAKLVFFKTVREYSSYFLLLYIVNSYYSIISNYARGKDSIKSISISGVIGTAIIITLNILMLVVFKMGIDGYFIANITGVFAQGVYLSIATKIHKDIDWRIKRNKQLEKTMRRYSGPLMVNNIAWWVNSVSDRYVVTYFCGIAENGIYSIAYKIPSIISIFQSIFGQAWTLFAIKELGNEKDNERFSTVYAVYQFIIILTCSLLISLNIPIAKLLYAKDFFIAWRYVPFLILSSLFNALSAYMGGIFAAGKQSKTVMNSTMIGAAVNIVLNIVLTPTMGVLGAAVATAFSYFIVFCHRDWAVKKIIVLQENRPRSFIAYSMIVLQTILGLLLGEACLSVVVNVICCIAVLLMYNKEIKQTYRYMRRIV